MMNEYIEDLLTVGCCPEHDYSCEQVYYHVKHQKKVIDRLSRKIQQKNRRINKALSFISECWDSLSVKEVAELKEILGGKQ